MAASNTHAWSGQFVELVIQGTVGVATDNSPAQVNPEFEQNPGRPRTRAWTRSEKRTCPSPACSSSTWRAVTMPPSSHFKAAIARLWGTSTADCRVRVREPRRPRADLAVGHAWSRAARRLGVPRVVEGGLAGRWAQLGAERYSAASTLPQAGSRPARRRSGCGLRNGAILANATFDLPLLDAECRRDRLRPLAARVGLQRLRIVDVIRIRQL